MTMPLDKRSALFRRRMQATPIVNSSITEKSPEIPLKSANIYPNQSLELLPFPKLFLGEFSGPRSYSHPEIHQAGALFAVEMEITSAGLKKKFLFDSKKDEANNNFENLLKRSHPDSFFGSMRPMLYIAQAFAMFPISGISGENSKNIKFKWIDWRVFHVFFNFSGVIFLCLCSLIAGLNEGLTYNGAAPIVFYLCSAIGAILFLNLARHWAEMCRYFAITEQKLAEYGYPKNQRRKFLSITVIFTFCAFVEHGLSKLVDIMKSLPCGDHDENKFDVVYTFFLRQYNQIFTLFNYNIFLGILVLYFNFCATVCWNIMDLFLGLIGMSISARLKQINENLTSVLGKEKSSKYWKTVREQFNAVSILTKQVDHQVQRIMLLSLGDNLFFICLQLLKSLKKRESSYQTVYFFWSFGFLIVRACFVTLCASGVFDESREGKMVLFSVPQNGYCHEVRRFLTQLSTDELTLTGCRFFSVTRGLMLTCKVRTHLYSSFSKMISHNNHPESFFRATRPAMALAQYFALNPFIPGFYENCSPSKMKTQPIKILYATYAAMGNFFILICVIKPFLTQALNYDHFSSIFFYFCCLAIFISFCRISQSWVRIQQSFVALETLFERHGYPKTSLMLKIILITFLSAATVEHLSGLIKVYLRAVPCAHSPGTILDIIDSFFKINYSKLFRVVNYHFILGCIFFHINILCTFWWNFLDLFLITVSISLSSRFGQLNCFISRHQWKTCSSKFWRRVREEYNALAQLTKNVDSVIGVMVALSFLSNIVVICQQLLRSIYIRRKSYENFYLLWSFGFYLLKTLAASLSMAEVHNRAKKCKSVLFCVPAESYCEEVERFLLQLETDEVGLTGCGLFTASRRVLVTIAGTILTYEIVLLQFDSFIVMDKWSSVGNRTYCFD